MANQTAVAKLWEKRSKEAKEYKTTHDVERAHHLIGALTQLKDHTGAVAVAASFARELAAMNAKQADLDAKEKEQQEKENAEAIAADAKAATQDAEEKKSGSEEHESLRAPSVPRRS